MNSPVLQRVRRDRPPLPVQFLTITPEEYRELLEKSGFSEHLIVKEIERLSVFQDMFKPAKATPSNVEIEEDDLVKIAQRRRERGRRRPDGS